MALDKDLIKILACPECKVGVKHHKKGKKESLSCPKCKRIFPVIDDIPHMMPKDSISD